ncbi:hypothetical protein C1Y40_05834 [Mycobacterium talmoniae]|uniref:Uncharacterized protein n=1 Tax=Mycobacterium talmoniae TaxID=1858794 RepID=A0A2S8BBH6_9MYCO|nr:hypothetical protein C1Y40_05834 [Mycobacterium talmoniae]
MRTVATPPGIASTSLASPPPDGSRHSAAGGLSVSSALPRAETNSRSPSAVNAGDDSPCAPRVSRRAGWSPCGSSSQIAAMYSVRLSLSSATVVTSRVPSAETARPDTRGSAR